jgi:hypothetical protein
MASLHGPPPTLAVVIVVDSSITLASEWPRILHDYVPQLFRRLAGDSPSTLSVQPLFLSRFWAHSQIFHPHSIFASDLSLTDPRIAMAPLFLLNVSSL